jgi:hypothetical protein
MSGRNTNIAMAIAFAIASTAAPAFAEATTDGNAHHYQGGPKTGVPHATKHTQAAPDMTTGSAANTGHHYNGGPKSENHHMGEKQ